MPIDRKAYPTNWPLLRIQVRARAEGQCECQGECGLHHGRRCIELHQKPARWFRGTVALQTAHICNHGQACAILGHLKAYCQRCHLRFDKPLHWLHRKSNPLSPRTPQTSTQGKSPEKKLL